MKPFLNVVTPEHVLGCRDIFQQLPKEIIPLINAAGRILFDPVVSNTALPEFNRATMDGYAVQALSTFGASESNPAMLHVKATIQMGESPEISIWPQESARIATGGMLPSGADAVVMLEHTGNLDENTIEVYKPVAPLENVIEIGEDAKEGDTLLLQGTVLNAPKIGLLAALGYSNVAVYQRPKVAIISTGDEIVAIDHTPKAGQIRDVNSHTLNALVYDAGAIPVLMGIAKDDRDALLTYCHSAINMADMVLISGGSSVGARDYTLEVLSQLPDSEVLVHGVGIKPGKPTILARSGQKALWGLPGHVVSAMIVFRILVQPFINHIAGRKDIINNTISATLTRNIPAAQGQVEYIRVKLINDDMGNLLADPIIGKSGVLHTMICADGLIAIEKNIEGLEKGTQVWVRIL